LPCPDDNIIKNSTIEPTWLQILVKGYDDDHEMKKLWSELSLSLTNDKGYSLVQSVIRLRGCIWVVKSATAQQNIMKALHSSGIGGHSGVLAMYQRIKRMFSCPQMKPVLTYFVTTYSVCQQAKAEEIKMPGQLQPLPIPPFP
jgi:hypothetical protein